MKRGAPWRIKQGALTSLILLCNAPRSEWVTAGVAMGIPASSLLKTVLRGRRLRPQAQFLALCAA